MIKKFKELGHSASLIQKLILVSGVLLLNYFLWLLIDAIYYAPNQYIRDWIALTWFVVIIPISFTLAYHLFPKKD